MPMGEIMSPLINVSFMIKQAIRLAITAHYFEPAKSFKLHGPHT